MFYILQRDIRKCVKFPNMSLDMPYNVLQHTPLENCPPGSFHIIEDAPPNSFIPGWFQSMRL